MLKRKKKGFMVNCVLLFHLFLSLSHSYFVSFSFRKFSIYWWEALFLFTLVIFTYDQKEEEGAGHFQNIILGQLTYRIQIRKIILTVKDLILASLFFLLILYLVSLFLVE